jgi:hypothetical protein
MNQKFKELALEAGGSHYPEVNSVQLEKFANLVVQECIDNIKVWEKDSRNHISYLLEKHFEDKS